MRTAIPAGSTRNRNRRSALGAPGALRHFLRPCRSALGAPGALRHFLHPCRSALGAPGALRHFLHPCKSDPPKGAVNGGAGQSDVVVTNHSTPCDGAILDLTDIPMSDTPAGDPTYFHANQADSSQVNGELSLLPPCMVRKARSTWRCRVCTSPYGDSNVAR
jgi:hypothetical protein